MQLDMNISNTFETCKTRFKYNAFEICATCFEYLQRVLKHLQRVLDISNALKHLQRVF